MSETTIPVGSGTDRLWVEDTGGDGPAVVLVHPGIHDSRVWDPVVPLLADHRLVRYDARGFGRSSASGEAFRAMDDLLAVLDHCGLSAAHLVGNSAGGGAVLATVTDRADRVLSVTVIAPAIAGYDWPDDAPELEEAYAEAAASGDPEQVAAVSARIWCACGVDDAIAVPTTVVIGERDVASMVTAAPDLAAAIPGAELVRLPDADHLPSLRDPQAVAAAIRRTVARAG